MVVAVPTAHCHTQGRRDRLAVGGGANQNFTVRKIFTVQVIRTDVNGGGGVERATLLPGAQKMAKQNGQIWQKLAEIAQII